MSTSGVRAAIYLRVSRDDQTTENQRLVLERVAQHRGWVIVQTHEDQGISGAKGRDQRPAFDTAQGRGTATVRCPNGLVHRPAWMQRSPRGECPRRTRCCWRGALFRPTGHRQHDANGTSHDPDGVRVRRAGTADHPQQGSCRSRPRASAGEEARCPKVSTKVEDAIRRHLSAGNGILRAC
jgi:Resolvase, N terminal domain